MVFVMETYGAAVKAVHGLIKQLAGNAQSNHGMDSAAFTRRVVYPVCHSAEGQLPSDTPLIGRRLCLYMFLGAYLWVHIRVLACVLSFCTYPIFYPLNTRRMTNNSKPQAIVRIPICKG